MTNRVVEEAVRAAFAANPDNPVLARLAAAQAVLESGLADGTPSGLVQRAKNYFGIKGRGSAGSVTMNTREAWGFENAQFRAYHSAEESFDDHRQLMEKNRYRSVLNASTLGEAAHAVQRAGYATDPNYADKLISVYERHIAPLIASDPEYRKRQVAEGRAYFAAREQGDAKSARRHGKKFLTGSGFSDEMADSMTSGMEALSDSLAKLIGFILSMFFDGVGEEKSPNPTLEASNHPPGQPISPTRVASAKVEDTRAAAVSARG
ncbi:MAG: glycoside hydrolase family 73 protein [Alphaproteobacteria bacterium]